MDDRQFDEVARAIGQTTNRRQAIRGLMALAAGAVGLTVAGADAARRGYGGPGEASSRPGDPELRFGLRSARGASFVSVYNAPPNASGTVDVYHLYDREEILEDSVQISTDDSGFGRAILYGIADPCKNFFRGIANIDGVQIVGTGYGNC